LFSGVANKCGCLLAAHVLLQNLRLGSEQVHHDQDLELGGRLACFNVDESFSGGVDGPSGSISSSSCETSSRSARRARSPLSPRKLVLRHDNYIAQRCHMSDSSY